MELVLFSRTILYEEGGSYMRKRGKGSVAVRRCLFGARGLNRKKKLHLAWNYQVGTKEKKKKRREVFLLLKSSENDRFYRKLQGKGPIDIIPASVENVKFALQVKKGGSRRGTPLREKGKKKRIRFNKKTGGGRGRLLVDLVAFICAIPNAA